jgi:hypothetical protein
VRGALVAGGAHDEHAVGVGEAERVGELGDRRGRHAAAELEAHVDDLGAVENGEDDAGRDRRGVAVATPVEYADGHDSRAVGEPCETDPVVRLLGDCPGDLRAVAVVVVGIRAVIDEVVAADELLGREIR